MYDLAALAIVAVCFAAAFVILYVLEQVRCPPRTSSALRLRCSSSRTSCMHCSGASVFSS